MNEPLSRDEYVSMQIEIQSRYVENVAKALEPLLAKINPHLDPERRLEDLRDSFAAAALSAMDIQNSVAQPAATNMARSAYLIADEMLKARE